MLMRSDTAPQQGVTVCQQKKMCTEQPCIREAKALPIHMQKATIICIFTSLIWRRHVSVHIAWLSLR